MGKKLNAQALQQYSCPPLIKCTNESLKFVIYVCFLNLTYVT